MSVEEFRYSCTGDRDENFYRGSFNCARGALNRALESIGSATEYFIDVEDPDFKALDLCIFGLMASLNRIEARMKGQTSKENTNG